jgi:glutathione peroxidase
MFAKVDVNGDGACALYDWLKAEQPADDGTEDIPWNFTKFLVAPGGKVVKRFHPKVTPEEIAGQLDEYL